jgi:NitT/TauT family transport system substrate-binding protein
MTATRILPLAVAVTALAATLTACGGDGDSPSGGDVDKVTYLTSFSTFGRDAYVYVAEEQGFFEAAGIDVDIRPGSGTVDVLRLVASGQADFGAGDFTTTAITVANEALPVVAVGAIHQSSLSAIMALESTGIRTPADLPGRTVGDQPGSTIQVMFPVYAQAAGIDPDQVEFVPGQPPQLPTLLASGQVDAIGQFVVGQGTIEAAAGEPVTVLPYSDVLPDLYGNALVTSTQTAEQDPDLVRRFSEALLKGLAYSVSHPEETGQILVERQPAEDATVAAREVELMAPAVGTGDQVGTLDRDRVQGTIEILVEAGAIGPGLTPDDVVDFDLIPGS